MFAGFKHLFFWIALFSLPILVELPSQKKRSLMDVGFLVAEEYYDMLFDDIEDGGKILPSANYLSDDLQYFPPGESGKGSQR